MKRWVFFLIVAVSLGACSLGIFGAYAVHHLAHVEGRMQSSAEWYRQVSEIEAQLARDGRAHVGDWVLVVDKARPKVLRVKRR